MNIFDYEKFQLIKRDSRELRTYLFSDNDINEWTKLIIIYNIYLFFSHFYVLYVFAEYFSNNNKSFNEDYKKIFMLFFILCNTQNNYRYFILNVSKIDVKLANSFYKNTNEYFI